jgi:protein SCO1
MLAFSHHRIWLVFMCVSTMAFIGCRGRDDKIMKTQALAKNEVAEQEKLGSLYLPKELAAAQIEDKAGALLPLDVELIDQNGQVKKLREYFRDDDDRPVILTLGYYGCPMLCSLVLKGLHDGLKDLKLTLGKDYRVISVSIDHRETIDLAKKKQATYLASLNADEESWNFHVARQEEVKRLADAVGFNYFYDARDDQFGHGAGFFVVSPKGVLSRTLYGIRYDPGDIKFALLEAAEGNIGSFVDKVLLSCFHYNPDSHRYGIYIVGVMRIGGFLTIAILGLLLLMYFRGEIVRS